MMTIKDWGWGYILLGICEVGVFSSISFLKKIVIASGGGGGASPTEPALLLHFSESILSNLKTKKETVTTKIKSQKLWAFYVPK